MNGTILKIKGVVVHSNPQITFLFVMKYDVYQKYILSYTILGHKLVYKFKLLNVLICCLLLACGRFFFILEHIFNYFNIF